MALQYSVLVVLVSVYVSVFGATTWDCNTYLNSGCGSNGVFTAVGSPGFNNVPNSQCRRTYRLRVNVPAGESGFYCTFYMDRPEQYKNVYSISESSTQTSVSSSSAYIYGYGLDARLYTKDTTSVIESVYYYNNIHTHPDDNGYSFITYRIENDKVRVSSSQGTSSTIGNVALYNPTSVVSNYYIGINRRYADTTNQGSGVCRVLCRTF